MNVTQARLTPAQRLHYQVTHRLRYLWLTLTTPVLKKGGGQMFLGPGARIRVSRGGQIVRGRAFTVRRNFTAYVQGTFTVGDSVFFNEGGFVSVFGDVTIGDNVRFGERVSIHDENHVFGSSSDSSGLTVKPVRIGSNTWVGANSVITAGSVLGEGSVLAAGSVLTGEIPPHVLAGGVPAKVLRSL